jgi:hypothetical protein
LAHIMKDMWEVTVSRKCVAGLLNFPKEVYNAPNDSLARRLEPGQIAGTARAGF